VPVVGEGVVVRPDQVSLGVLVNAVPRDAVDDAVAACGVRERRSDGKLPAHVITYLTLALTLFPDDDYTEVATKVTGSLDRWGCWRAAWTVPTASAITQARKRLGREVFAELFERCCGPVAGPAGPAAENVALGTARGSFLRRWRLLGIDGFEIDVADSSENAAEFGYAGSGANRSAFPKARVVALAECGTHAFVAAEVDAYSVGERTLAARLYPRLRADELLTADRGFYSWPAWDSAAATGAALLWRAPTQLELPVVRVLPDGTFLTVLIAPTIRGARRARLLAAARAGDDLTDINAVPDAYDQRGLPVVHLARVVEYDVPDRVPQPTSPAARALASRGQRIPIRRSRRLCPWPLSRCGRAVSGDGPRGDAVVGVVAPRCPPAVVLYRGDVGPQAWRQPFTGRRRSSSNPARTSNKIATTSRTTPIVNHRAEPLITVPCHTFSP
jgi:hypothetical protein